MTQKKKGRSPLLCSKRWSLLQPWPRGNNVITDIEFRDIVLEQRRKFLRLRLVRRIISPASLGVDVFVRDTGNADREVQIQ